MGNPIPIRGITGHLVWGADGAVWACFEVEPFAYPHRSVRDARQVHARTTAALLAVPTHSLILSIANSLSRDELERRIRGENPGQAPGWAATARRTARRPPPRSQTLLPPQRSLRLLSGLHQRIETPLEFSDNSRNNEQCRKRRSPPF